MEGGLRGACGHRRARAAPARRSCSLGRGQLQARGLEGEGPAQNGEGQRPDWLELRVPPGEDLSQGQAARALTNTRCAVWI